MDRTGLPAEHHISAAGQAIKGIPITRETLNVRIIASDVRQQVDVAGHQMQMGVIDARTGMPPATFRPMLEVRELSVRLAHPQFGLPLRCI
jgi:hypothetical protein